MFRSSFDLITANTPVATPHCQTALPRASWITLPPPAWLDAGLTSRLAGGLPDSLRFRGLSLFSNILGLPIHLCASNIRRRLTCCKYCTYDLGIGRRPRSSN